MKKEPIYRFKCYWCENSYNYITEHFKIENGQYKCPDQIVDSEKHLKPHVLSKIEDALEAAYDKNR